MDYIHGYSSRESERLTDQADTLAALVLEGITFPAGHLVLEPGCGVGSQTVHIAAASPAARFVSVDISEASLAAARHRVAGAGLANVSFECADVYELPFPDHAFDAVFVCFLLEHLPRPQAALTELRRVLRESGSITAIEGDHGSAYFHPDSEEAREAIRCLVELQARAGGNALIGRQLHPLLSAAGFRDVHVEPRMVYVDASRPDLVDGFTRRTFTAMVEGVRDQALEQGLMAVERWDRGIADLHRAAAADGTFCYTFFRAVAGR
ncbi:MAG TPA: methyltransferase domain-containing protein [Candidatus Binatia bacterium]|nr:methyltransferase domain-containing protein [Candidatus Binatia bacterium]